ncbi:apolipoprotein C-I-like isoform X1 [Pseudophryne corroboree]|uniref:apolipoprotein C-I-like isoform X1 n=1 Tax=Pseudophryne corroboree TaxID=495146 RepID=UPI0030818EF1
MSGCNQGNRSSLCAVRLLSPAVVKMKLILAVSVVLVALSVMAEPSSAQSEESTIKTGLKSFVESVKQVATKVGEKTKAVFKELHESEPATKARNFFSDTFQKIKDKLS